MKIPEPRQLRSGNWFIQLRVGGVSTSITETTAERCRAKAYAIKAGVETKQSASSMTLRTAIDKYIQSRSNVLSPSTIRGYRSMQDNRFCEVMDKSLKSVKDWQGAINREAANISSKYLHNVWGLIHPVLCANGINVNVELPAKVQKEKPWLTPEQIGPFLAAVHGKDCELAALLALSSLRRSEIFGLTWDKIDLARKTIRVEGASVKNEKHKVIRKETNKNSTSRRTVPIMIPELYDLLSSSENKTGPIVTGHIDSQTKKVDRICVRAGLPLVGLHGLRHSFASLGYHLGMSEMEVMQIGGWSDIQTMRKIYTHLAESDRLAAQNKMAEYYKGLSAVSNQNAN